MGRQHQQRGAVGENQYQQKNIIVHWGLFWKITQLLQHRWQDSTEPCWASDGSALWCMAPGHPCIPSILPLVLDVLPSDCSTITWPSSLLSSSWKKRKFCLCTLKGTCLGKDTCWPAGNRFPNSVLTCGCFKFFSSSKVRHWLAGSRLPAIASR
jgi:hypothetical protein